MTHTKESRKFSFTDALWLVIALMLFLVFAASAYDQVFKRSSDVAIYYSPRENVHCYSSKEFGQHAMSCFYQEDVE